MPLSNPVCKPGPCSLANGPEEETLRALGWLSLGLAHDLNNLLTIIMGAADLASDKTAPATPHELDIIQQACLEGQKLVKTLSGYCRKDGAGTEVVDLNKVATMILRFLPHAGNGKVGILQDLAPDKVLVMGRETALTSALVNIMANALDAMPLGGMLLIRTRIEGPDTVSITIQDTGEGMSAATLARATETLFTTKPVGKGTGLGLAMVRGTVEAHRGTLTLSSEEGNGTTVRIELPRAACDGCDDMDSGS